MPHAADASSDRDLPATDDGFLTPFMRHAAATPDRVFARVGGRELTFGALEARSATLATWLRANGVDTGDRVALMLRNSETALALMLAIARAGAVWVPVNTQALGDNLAYVLSHAGATCHRRRTRPRSGHLGLRRGSAVRNCRLLAMPWPT